MRLSILKQRHWTIFIAFLVCMLGAHLIVEFIADIFDLRWFDKSKQVTEFLLTMPVLFSYPFLVDQQLRSKLKGQVNFKRTTNSYLIIVTVLFLATYLLTIFAAEFESIVFYVLGIINALCMLTLFSFPARLLKSIELKRNAGLWEYVPETFQFLCWPLGVWWIQPRLSKIATKNIIIAE